MKNKFVGSLGIISALTVFGINLIPSILISSVLNVSKAEAAVYQGRDDRSDNLVGGSGDDTLNGLGLHDSLSGGGGNDLLLGGKGEDYLNGFGGGSEIDILDGGVDQDIDIFVIGKGNSTYYKGANSYAILRNVDVNRDMIDVASNGDAVNLKVTHQSFNGVGTSAQDTIIKLGSDVIAIIQDKVVDQNDLNGLMVAN